MRHHSAIAHAATSSEGSSQRPTSTPSSAATAKRQCSSTASSSPSGTSGARTASTSSSPGNPGRRRGSPRVAARRASWPPGSRRGSSSPNSSSSRRTVAQLETRGRPRQPRPVGAGRPPLPRRAARPVAPAGGAVGEDEAAPRSRRPRRSPRRYARAPSPTSPDCRRRAGARGAGPESPRGSCWPSTSTGALRSPPTTGCLSVAARIPRARCRRGRSRCGGA